MLEIRPLTDISPARFETAAILKKVASAGRRLAELKGVAASIPNQGILINTLGLQEAKDSSAIENIVTTHDELFRDSLFPDEPGSPATKEVQRYKGHGEAAPAVARAAQLTADRFAALP